MLNPAINAAEALIAILAGLVAIEEFIRNQLRGEGRSRGGENQKGGGGGMSDDGNVGAIPNRRKRNPLLSIAAIVLVFDLTIFLLGTFLFHWNFSMCYPFAPASASITSPASGSHQPLLITAQGGARHIPSDKELWLLVVPAGVQGYFPQNGKIVVSDDGAWSASATLGQPADVGRDFTIHIALVDQQGKSVIDHYLASAPNFTPIFPLPPGIESVGQVTVTRT